MAVQVDAPEAVAATADLELLVFHKQVRRASDPYGCVTPIARPQQYCSQSFHRKCDKLPLPVF
jgi:hypothetical protein